jgi:hypothetical protein
MNIFKVLQKLRDDIISWCSKNFARKLNKNLGTDKANKILITNQYGEVTAADINATQMVTEDTLNTAIETEANRAKAAEKKISDAVATLTNGAGTTEIDSVKELIDYVNEHGTTTEQIQKDIKANADAIAQQEEKIDANSTLLSNQENLWLDLQNRVTGLEEGVDNSDNVVGQMQAAISQNTSSLSILRAEQANIRNQAGTNATNIGALEERLADLEYVPIVINEFSVTSSPFEKGDTEENPLLYWKINKEPTSLTISEETLESISQSGTHTVIGDFSEDKSWTLTASDGKNTVSKTAYIRFYNGVYYGVSSTDILSLDLSDPDILSKVRWMILQGNEYGAKFTKTLQPNRSITISGAASSGEYVYYLYPKDYREVSKFTDNDNGLGYAFMPPIVMSFRNNQQHTEDYYVYRSANAIAGTFNITVS